MRASPLRSPRFFIAAAGLALVAVAACTSEYQKGADDPNYGAPNALAGQRQPGPSSENGGAGGGEGGTSGGGTTAPVCVTAGGSLIDGGPCTVSFSKDVLPALGAATPACTLPSCHGGLNPPNPPKIEPADAKGMYQEFAGFKMSNGAPYINPCSTEVNKSGLACNLYATGACGTHMPQGGQMAQDQITKIETWLKCGSPNN
jgi:hypothetical protein